MSAKDLVIGLVIRARDEASDVLGAVKGKVTQLAAGIAAALGGISFGAAVAGAADLELALDRVQAKGDETYANTKRLREELARIATQYGITSASAAQGLEVLAAAGLNATDALGALPSVLALAKNESLGFERAAELITGAAGTLGLAFGEAARIADVLTKGANITQTSAAELGEALKLAGGAGRAAGLDLEQLVAHLNALSVASIRGGEGGTALRNILSALADPAGKVRLELARLGDGTGQLSNAIDTLAKSGRAGEAAILAFGADAGPGVRALISAGTKGVADYERQLRAAGGAADETTQKLGGNLTSAFSRLLASITEAATRLAEPLLAPLTAELDAVNKSIRGAADDGTLAAFGERIRSAFTDALKWVREFAGGVDFGDALVRIQEFARLSGEAITSLSVSARTAAAVISAAWNGLLAPIKFVAASAVSVVADVIGALAFVEEQAAKVGLGSKARADELRLKVEGLRGVYDGLKSSAVDSLQATQDALGRLTSSVADGAARQTDAQNQIASAAQATDAEIQRQIDAVAKSATAQHDAAVAAVAAGNQQAEAALAAADKIEALRTEYLALAQAGDTKAAVAALARLNEALGKTGAISRQAGHDVSAAFAELGIVSSKALGNVAEKNRRAFEDIRNSGTASAGDVQRAFLKYAESALEAARAAGDGSEQTVQAQLASQAAVLGVTAEYLRLTGQTNAAADATERLLKLQQQQQQGGGGKPPVQQETEDTTKAVIAATNAFADFTAEITGYGVEAARLFDANLHAAGLRDLSTGLGGVAAQAAQSTDTLEGMRAALAKLEAETHAGGANETDSNLAAWGRAANATKREILEAKIEVAELEKKFSDGTATAGDLARAVGVVRDRAKLLGEERLSGLNEAMEAFRQNVQGLNSDLQSTLQRLEDQNAQLKGNAIESERLRYVRERAEIEAQARAAQQAGDAAAIAAAARAQRLSVENHRLTLAQIAEQRRAERQRATEQHTEAARAPATAAPSTAPADALPAAAAPAAPTQVVRMTRVQLVAPNGRRAEIDTPETSADAVVRDLVRLFEVTR